MQELSRIIDKRNYLFTLMPDKSLVQSFMETLYSAMFLKSDRKAKGSITDQELTDSQSYLEKLTLKSKENIKKVSLNVGFFKSVPHPPPRQKSHSVCERAISSDLAS